MGREVGEAYMNKDFNQIFKGWNEKGFDFQNNKKQTNKTTFPPNNFGCKATKADGGQMT